MNEIEQYEFDRLGYLVIPDMLTDDQVRSLSLATDCICSRRKTAVCA